MRIIEMKVYTENDIRKQADLPGLELLAQWHALCENKLGFDLEVAVADRHEHPQLKRFQGELNTALPLEMNGELKLVLLMDRLVNVSPIILSHELSHWIAKLQGVKAAFSEGDRHSDVEILLNSLCQHRVVYQIQRSVGIDPTPEIESRVEHNISIFSKPPAPKGRKRAKRSALLLADDLLSCSSEKYDRLMGIVDEQDKQTSSFVKEILDIATRYDLCDKEQLMPFERMLITQLGLAGHWRFGDEVEELKRVGGSISK